MQTVRTVPLFFSVLFFYNSGHFFRCLCLLSEDGGMLSPERFSLWSSLISNPLPCVFPSLWSPDRYLSRTQVSRAPLCEQSVGKIFADHSQGSPVFSLFVSPEGSFILCSIWNKKNPCISTYPVPSGMWKSNLNSGLKQKSPRNIWCFKQFLIFFFRKEFATIQ